MAADGLPWHPRRTFCRRRIDHCHPPVHGGLHAPCGDHRTGGVQASAGCSPHRRPHHRYRGVVLPGVLRGAAVRFHPAIHPLQGPLRHCRLVRPGGHPSHRVRPSIPGQYDQLLQHFSHHPGGVRLCPALPTVPRPEDEDRRRHEGHLVRQTHRPVNGDQRGQSDLLHLRRGRGVRRPRRRALRDCLRIHLDPAWHSPGPQGVRRGGPWRHRQPPRRISSGPSSWDRPNLSR